MSSNQKLSLAQLFDSIRNSFMLAADYEGDLTGKRIIYNSHFDWLFMTEEWNRLVVKIDLRANFKKESSNCDLVVCGQNDSSTRRVSSSDYLILGKDNDHPLLSSEILTRDFGL